MKATFDKENVCCLETKSPCYLKKRFSVPSVTYKVPSIILRKKLKYIVHAIRGPILRF